jgi:TolB protein
MVPLPGCWTNDGKNVLIALMDMQSRESTIWKISVDGKEKKQITGHHEYFYRYLALSPDDSLLVYTAMEDGFLRLYIMSIEGGNSISLETTPEGGSEGPSWSPDGKKIAFSRTIARNDDIWIMDLNIEQITKKLQVLNE